MKSLEERCKQAAPWLNWTGNQAAVSEYVLVVYELAPTTSYVVQALHKNTSRCTVLRSRMTATIEEGIQQIGWPFLKPRRRNEG